MLDIENCMEIIIQLSEEKYNSVEKIYKLTKEQSEAILSEDIEKLQKLIGKKQIEINTIQSLDKRVEKIITELKSVYNIQGIEELNGYNEEIKRIQYINKMIINKAKQVNDIEVNNRSELIKSKQQLENKIRSLKSGKKAVSGYGYNIQNPVFFDKKSGK